MPKLSSNEIIELCEAIKKDDQERLRQFTYTQMQAFEHHDYKNIFLYAIRYGNIETVKTIVEILSNLKKLNFESIIYAADYKDRNALMLAANFDDVDSLRYLLSKFTFKIDDLNKRRDSALIFAIRGNCKRAFRYLMEHGAVFGEYAVAVLNESISFKNFFNSPECFLLIVKSTRKILTAFRTIMRHVETQSDLIQSTFIQELDEQNRNALILASKMGNISMVRSLSRLPFDLNVQDKTGHGVLYYLGSHGFLGLVAEFLNKFHEIEPAHGLSLTQFSKKLFTSTKVSKKKIGDSLTYNPGNFTKSGRIPKISIDEIQRPYRSYTKERERQLLRHVATQIFFPFKEMLKDKEIQLKKELGSLTEIQIMHLNFSGKDFVFYCCKRAFRHWIFTSLY